jgi:DNA-binding protein YbaB
MTKGLGNILKQAQQIHAKISQLQEEMAGRTVEASSGGGMVNIVMNGKQEVLAFGSTQKWSIEKTLKCYKT